MAASTSDRRGVGLDRERLRLELRRARGPFAALVALTIVAAICTGVILKNIGFRLPWANTYATQIAVDDAKGIVAGKDAVRFSGVEIGRIDKVSLKGEQPVLKISFDGKYGPLYRDAQVEVRPSTPLNDLFVNIISRGHATAGKLGESDTLQAGRTKTPVDVGKVLNVFNADTRDRVGEAIDGYGEGLGDHGAAFRAALVQLTPFLAAAKRLTHETAIRKTQTARLVHNFRLMTEELASRDKDLRGVVQNGASSLSELGGSEVSIQQVLQELPPTLNEVQRSFATLRNTANHLDPALDALRPTAKELPEGLDALKDFSVKARPSLAAIRTPLPKLNQLMTSLRPTANALDTAFTRLSPQVPRLDGITQKIVPCETALQKFFQNTISLTKFYDDKGVIVRGETVVGSNSVAGLMNDANVTAAKSCVAGGPAG